MIWICSRKELLFTIMIICNECNNYIDDFDFGRSVCICLIYIQIVAGSWVERSFFHQHHQQLLPLFLKLNRLPEGGWPCLGPCLSRWYWTLECAAATGKWSLFSVSNPFPPRRCTTAMTSILPELILCAVCTTAHCQRSPPLGQNAAALQIQGIRGGNHVCCRTSGATSASSSTADASSSQPSTLWLS